MSVSGSIVSDLIHFAVHSVLNQNRIGTDPMVEIRSRTMAVTIQASTQGLDEVDKARRRKRWAKTEKAWVDLAVTSVATLKRFWSGAAIEAETFQEICKSVGITDWESIADFDITNERGSANNTCSKSDRVKYVVVLSATIDEVDKPLLEAIVAHLSKVSGDTSLTLQKMEEGSIKLYFEGSPEGLAHLEFLFRTGQLTDVLGVEVQGFEGINSEKPIAQVTNSNQYGRESENKSGISLEKRLEDWIFASCTEEGPLSQRRVELNAMFRSIYSDRRFWQYRNAENRGYYEEALSRMWQYFMQNLREATTAKKSGSFLETRSVAVGRLLTNLKSHLRNIQMEMRHVNSLPIPNEIDTLIDFIEVLSMLSNPEPDLAAQQYEALLSLLESDPTGELTAEENTLRGKEGAYTLTAQRFLLMRHRDGMTMHQIADQLGIPRGALQGGAKLTQWKELERKFAQMAIDSVSD
jgi:hypothetical protein